MKNLFIVLLAAMVFVGCRHEAETSLVEGNIKGLANDTVYIYSIDGSYEQVDTIVAEKGRFSYTTAKDTLTANLLLFADGTEFPLFIGKKEHIKIEGDTAALHRLQVEGGTANADYARYLEALQMPDSIATTTTQITQRFIRQNNTSPVSVYLINRLAQTEDPDFKALKELIKGLAGTLQDDPRIVFLNEWIEREEKLSTGKVAPFFNLKNAKGEKITRNDSFKDKYLVVHFWASWDDSSRVSNAEMRKLHRKYKKTKEVGLLGISLDVDKAQWKDAVEQDTLTWEQGCDFAGMNSEVVNLFALHQLPSYLLISPSGRIVLRNVSPDSIATRIDKDVAADRERERKKKK